MEKTVYECESCKETGNKIFVFEGAITKKILNGPKFPPNVLKQKYPV